MPVFNNLGKLLSLNRQLPASEMDRVLAQFWHSTLSRWPSCDEFERPGWRPHPITTTSSLTPSAYGEHRLVGASESGDPWNSRKECQGRCREPATSRRREAPFPQEAGTPSDRRGIAESGRFGCGRGAPAWRQRQPSLPLAQAPSRRHARSRTRTGATLAGPHRGVPP